jgi:hypothetical protein
LEHKHQDDAFDDNPMDEAHLLAGFADVAAPRQPRTRFADLLEGPAEEWPKPKSIAI